MLDFLENSKMHHDSLNESGGKKAGYEIMQQ